MDSLLKNCWEDYKSNHGDVVYIRTHLTINCSIDNSIATLWLVAHRIASGNFLFLNDIHKNKKDLTTIKRVLILYKEMNR